MHKTTLSDTMWQALAAIDIHTLTPIQEAAIPVLLQGKNAMLQAPTGTGKTYAFLLPMLERLDVDVLKTQALIIAPTRELAQQIARVLRAIVPQYNAAITFELAVGGQDRARLLQTLAEKPPHILIGTPGRLEDILLREARLDTKEIKWVVLDETDMLFENGFLETIDRLFATFARTDVCYVVCSATISQEMQQFIKKYIKNIQFIDVKKNAAFKAKVEYLFWDITGKDRLLCLQQVMDVYDPYLALVFANTKKDVALIAAALRKNGRRIGVLHGDMKMRERAQMLKRITQLEYQYVICSDIAARGIDIDGVSHIINYQLPPEHALAFFHHRAGRTGRAQYQGTIFSLYEKKEIPKIQKLMKQDIVFEKVKLVKGTFVKQHVFERGGTKQQLDQDLLQLSRKTKARVASKKKVKPGYRKKIQRAVTQTLQQERKKRKKTRIKK